MYTPLHCIALRTIRLSDSKNFLSAWSRQVGRITISMPAGASREANRRRALTTPMALFECVGDIRPGKDIISVRDLRPMAGSPAMQYSPTKAMIAQFLGEVSDSMLRRTESDERLSDFLFASVMAFSATEGPPLTNFHLIYLYRLTHFAGIEPRLDGYAPGTVFDLREGALRPTRPLHNDFLSPADTDTLVAIARAGYSTADTLPLDRAARRRAVDNILQYFSLHLSTPTSFKSLSILRDLVE